MIAVTFLVSINLVLLAPAYMSLSSEQASAELRIANFTGKSSAQVAEEEQDASKTIADINKKMALLLGVSTSTNPRSIPSEVFESILSLKEGNIKISSLLYDATPEREQVVVSGRSLDRDSLARFVESLRQKSGFTTVDLPIHSYVKSTNIDFTITMSRVLKVAPPQKTK